MILSPYEGVQGADHACQKCRKFLCDQGISELEAYSYYSISSARIIGAFHKEAVERVIALPKATINGYVKSNLNTMH